MPNTEITPAAGTELVLSQEVMQQFAMMAAGIPDAADEDAYDSILSVLMNATTIDELNAPWDTVDAEDLIGYRLRIEGVKRLVSDFTGGLGMYLVLQGTNMGTGDKFTWTTGAISIVGQLARAHYLNAFPVTCELIIADRPTKNGYRPQHLKVLGFGGSK